MMKSIFVFLLSIAFATPPLKVDKNAILIKVNTLRAKGCYCGGVYQAPVDPVKWNATLQSSARSHAKEMAKYNLSLIHI